MLAARVRASNFASRFPKPIYHTFVTTRVVPPTSRQAGKVLLCVLVWFVCKLWKARCCGFEIMNEWMRSWLYTPPSYPVISWLLLYNNTSICSSSFRAHKVPNRDLWRKKKKKEEKRGREGSKVKRVCLFIHIILINLFFNYACVGTFVTDRSLPTFLRSDNEGIS